MPGGKHHIPQYSSGLHIPPCLSWTALLALAVLNMKLMMVARADTRFLFWYLVSHSKESVHRENDNYPMLP